MKLMHFTAEWCGPCQMMKPMISQVLAEHPEIEYVAIDIDQDKATAIAHEIMSVPTFIAFDGDTPTARFSGGMPKQKFLDALGI